ncbi:MAG: hypothetical protein Q8N81_06300 [bacterium]|nr:hypothetical protein [bacterium]
MTKEEEWNTAVKEIDEAMSRLSAKFGKAFDELNLFQKAELAIRYLMQCFSVRRRDENSKTLPQRCTGRNSQRPPF